MHWVLSIFEPNTRRFMSSDCIVGRHLSIHCQISSIGTDGNIGHKHGAVDQYVAPIAFTERSTHVTQSWAQAHLWPEVPDCHVKCRHHQEVACRAVRRST